MARNMLAVSCGVLLILSGGVAFADDLSMAFLLAPPGALLARAYTPTLPVETGAALSEEAAAKEAEGKEARPMEFQMQFGKTPFLESFSYKRFPAVSNYGELSGYAARRDYYRCGAVETGSKNANRALDTVADFFAGSPLLMEPEYYVQLSILLGEPLPQW